MLRARSISRIACRTLACALLLVLPSALAFAEVIDLSLNVLLTNPQNAAGGGSWQLVAKSDGFGLAGVKALVTDIDLATAASAGPRGTVNGSDTAGMWFTKNLNAALGFTEINVFQVPLIPLAGAGKEQTVFYGVGTLANGAPNYPGKPVGSNAIGPVFATLTDVAGVPWGLADPFQDPAWNGAALLATGTFSGAMPGFYASEENVSNGNTFLSLGTSTNYGTISNPRFAATTIVRSNLVQTADYNHNGVVDAADYVVWRKTFGSTAMLDADGNSNGMIDDGDYTVWRMNFGTVFGSGSGSGLGFAAVPEPTAIAMLAVGAAFSLCSLGRCLRRRDPRKSAPRELIMAAKTARAPG